VSLVTLCCNYLHIHVLFLTFIEMLVIVNLNGEPGEAQCDYDFDGGLQNVNYFCR